MNRLLSKLGVFNATEINVVTNLKQLNNFCPILFNSVVTAKFNFKLEKIKIKMEIFD